MQNNQSGIDDDELNKMIASLQQERRGSSTLSNGSQAAIQPPVATTPAVGQPAEMPTITGHQSAPANGFGQPAPVAESTGNGGEAVIQPLSAADNLGNTTAAETRPAEVPRSTALGNISGISNLDDIKRQALTELRPLVDKLNLAPEDKFDTLLLLIRTTDDSSLIPQAHEAAKAISDDARRAQALLDVIKEIDFFGRKK